MVDIPQASGGFLGVDRIVGLLGIAPGMHVAELGCGAGFFSIAMARVVGKEGVVSAVDIMEGPLENVQSMAESLGLGNVRPIRADLEVLGSTGIGDNTQDLAMLANTLFQSEKKEDMLRESVRMLKAGGRLVVIDWKKGLSGLGPPDELRISEDEIKVLAEKLGTKFEQTIDASNYHYGLVFRKL